MIQAQVKKLMLDAAAVEKAIGRRAQIALTRYGSFARQHARKKIEVVAPKASSLTRAFDNINSPDRRKQARGQKQLQTIRDKERQQSRPGGYPVARTNNRVVTIRNIRYYYDPNRRSVIFGPVKINRRGNVPETLEYGGTSKIRQARIRGKWVIVGRNFRARRGVAIRTRQIRVRARPTAALTYQAMQRRQVLARSFEYADRKLGGK